MGQKVPRKSAILSHIKFLYSGGYLPIGNIPARRAHLRRTSRNLPGSAVFARGRRRGQFILSL